MLLLYKPNIKQTKLNFVYDVNTVHLLNNVGILTNSRFDHHHDIAQYEIDKRNNKTTAGFRIGWISEAIVDKMKLDDFSLVNILHVKKQGSSQNTFTNVANQKLIGREKRREIII